MNFDIIIFQLVVLIFSVMIHEISHGFVAEYLGDGTARQAGRLTLNPIAHIDPFGSVLLPLMLSFSNLPVIGWAKPVPYNPNNLYKDYKFGPLKVALAGPFSNLAVVLVFGLLARFGAPFLSPPLIGFFSFIAFLNAFLAFFNLVPIPPLDGSKLLTLILPEESLLFFERMGFFGIFLVLLFVWQFSHIVTTLAAQVTLFVAGGDALGTMAALFLR